LNAKLRCLDTYGLPASQRISYIVVLKVEHLQADIEALEEEVERWKEAATEEAAAGAAVFEDVERCQDEVSLVFNCGDCLSLKVEINANVAHASPQYV
jgi:hypothetical protein